MKNRLTVLVTGSTGLLGLNTIDALLQRDYRVLALARNADKARKVLPDDPRVEIILGDIERPREWIHRLDGCDAVIHTAAYFREYFGRGEHDAKLTALNVDFPVRLVCEAAARRVPRSIVVSSTGVLQPMPDGSPSGENAPAKGRLAHNGYQQSKVQMEQALQALSLPDYHKMVLVRPGWMWGPKDFAPTATAQLILDMRRMRKFQMVDGLPFGIVDARDVAEGLARLVELPEPKPVYNIAGNNLRAIDALMQVAALEPGLSVQRVPLGLALSMSAILEFFTRLANARNPLPREGILVLADGVRVDSGLAIRDLGLTFRPFLETARDSLAFVKREFQPQG